MARVLILLFVIAALLPVAQSFAADLLWPLPGHETLTGGFADSRPDHFHGGVDVRTGPDPLPVVAPGKGWIERIAVSPAGYGRTLYLRLEDGRTAVFAHLSRFAPPFEQMLRDSQLAVGIYRVDFSFPESTPELCVRAGETIAYSGKTGIGPAHFHFEIRDGAVQTDPLTAYPRPDTEPPVITSASVTTLSAFTPWSSGKSLMLKRTGNGTWTAPPVEAAEPLAFFVRCYDPGPWGRNAVPSAVRVKVNGQTVFEDFPTRIDLLGPRNIYAKIVWPEREQHDRDLRRLHDILPPPDHRATGLPLRGWIADAEHAEVAIEIEDRSGNISRLSLPVTAGAFAAVNAAEHFPELAAGAFRLDTSDDPSALWVTVTDVSPGEVRIGPSGLAFGSRLRLTVSNAAPHSFLYERKASGARRPLNRANADTSATLSAWILRAGTYGVATDSLPPDLHVFVRNGRLHFRLNDDDSGIDDSTVRCMVDGQVAIAEFEYEERGGAIWTPNTLARGPHEIVFRAADRAGNLLERHETVRLP